MRLLCVFTLAFAVIAVGIACNDDDATPKADEARDATLQVDQPAQFYRRDLPSEAIGGPKVISASLAGRIRAGQSQQNTSGELESSATAIAMQLEGDVGYWIVRAGIPSSAAPTVPTFTANFALKTSLMPGPRRIVFRAVDGDGHFGPATIRSFDVVTPAAPSGRLVVTLAWNNGADLDLHLLLPTGVEIFKRNTTEYERPPPSAGPVDPNGPFDGGYLDRDSNARCVFDGQRAENVIFKEAPPKGHYIVRVDTFSLCGLPNAYWRVQAKLDGNVIGGSQGVSTDNDVRFSHNRGDGALSLEFDVP